MGGMHYNQNALGGRIINIINPQGIVNFSGTMTRLSLNPEAWDLSETWRVDGGELVGLGPDLEQLVSSIDQLTRYSVCLLKNEKFGKGFLEAILRIPNLPIGTAGLVARFDNCKPPSAIALILGGFGVEDLPCAALLSIICGKVKCRQTVQLKNRLANTNGFHLGLDFGPGRIRGFIQGEQAFDCKEPAYEGAGFIGFIKFSSTACWIDDPRAIDSSLTDEAVKPKSAKRHERVRNSCGIGRTWVDLLYDGLCWFMRLWKRFRTPWRWIVGTFAASLLILAASAYFRINHSERRNVPTYSLEPTTEHFLRHLDMERRIQALESKQASLQ
jgi:hypothetical protein